MRKIRMSLTVITLAALLLSCNLINPVEEIPALIKIDTVLVTVNEFDKGSDSHQMTDIWISVGGKTLGVFEMPALIPCLLDTASQWIFIRPGVKMNGMASTRVAYPFFVPYQLNVGQTVDLLLEAGKTSTITPTFTYKDECVFAWIEEFEDAGVTFSYASYSDTVFKNQNEIVKDGRFSGVVYLDSINSYFEARSAEDFTLPGDGTSILLEFDYLNTVEFEVGTYVIEDEVATWSSLIMVRKSDKWQRIYIDLHSTVAYETEADLFRMGFRAQWDSTGTATQSMLFDNIKLIHF